MTVASAPFFTAKRIIGCVVAGLLLIAAIVYFFPPKALYSYVPFLDIKFRTSNYPERVEILKILFKPGDDKAYVESLLVPIADYPANPIYDDPYGEDPYKISVVRYNWKSQFGKGKDGVSALYDERNKLRAMKGFEGDVFNSHLIKDAIEYAIQNRDKEGSEPDDNLLHR